MRTTELRVVAEGFVSLILGSAVPRHRPECIPSGPPGPPFRAGGGRVGGSSRTRSRKAGLPLWTADRCVSGPSWMRIGNDFPPLCQNAVPRRTAHTGTGAVLYSGKLCGVEWRSMGELILTVPHSPNFRRDRSPPGGLLPHRPGGAEDGGTESRGHRRRETCRQD
jgi:hypothetical protein